MIGAEEKRKGGKARVALKTRTEAVVSGAEQKARTAIEERFGRKISEVEWKRQKRNLVEFIQILARWDQEQRSGGHELELRQ